MSIIARIDEKIKLFENGYAFILDENSNVIYHPQMDSTLQYGEKVAIDSPDQVVGDHHVRYHYSALAAMNSQSLWKMKISATGISSLICSANIGTKYVPQQNTSGNRLIYPWALPCTTRNLTLP